MRKKEISEILQKKIKKLKGRELFNLLNKIQQIQCSISLNHYKNLKYDLKKFKRVHVNNSYVVMFFGDDGTVYFVDYETHDKIYLKNYKNLKF